MLVKEWKYLTTKLIQAADYDVEKAEKRIILFDEIDKVALSPKIHQFTTWCIWWRLCNRSLLKILEGTVASVPPQGGRKHPHQEF